MTKNNYFTWLKTYRSYVTRTILAYTLLVNLVTAGLYVAVKYYNRSTFPIEATDSTNPKFKKCSNYVWELLRENAQLRDMCR